MKISVRPKIAVPAALFLSVLAALVSVQLVTGEEPPSDAGAEKGDLVWLETWVKGEGRVELDHKTFSPNRELFAGFYRDGWDETISIHEAASGKQLKRIVGHGDNVKEFRFSPDGKLLASRSERRGWKVWDVKTGELVLELPVDKTAPADGAGVTEL